ncbi:Rv1733c family protein [Actinomadura scrupuli]|uniref:Rv1733c family protein n=1 Tax=Actinomadura scrupuli TaxID=559629 RepID=UPI003D95DA98
MEAEPHRILSRLDRARRRAGLDRNPMRRREDHIQSAVALLLVALYLVAASLAVFPIGSHVYAAGVRAEKTQATERHRVVGTVTDPTATRTARVTWREADGTWHTADYQGSKVLTDGRTRVWVDRSGHLTPQPRRHSQTVTDTGMAAVGVMLMLAISFSIPYYATRRRMDRNRYRRWDADWERAGVRWGLPGNRPDQW